MTSKHSNKTSATTEDKSKDKKHAQEATLTIIGNEETTRFCVPDIKAIYH